ncbi:putative RNA-binding protein YlmH [Peptoclostridium acidaminophilum DSM 3953]|uniref:Putative RNA-binding protein YlmH n=1 Tax=Peptoclostridium acidaminophilum DSM 3953 TaxID=1286171 RepID=W8TG29_PEPAC|nr:YlmH/Sll1252 family protein [Peptoclostridium acidaminophilum]AHM56783.1 putative RNA-binding protein YlmH [Peptoclostridium acidaminophilum DSM 3953]
MIDKTRLTVHIRDEELRRVVLSVIDKAQAVMKTHEIKTTDFLNPYELKSSGDVLNSLKGEISYITYGGYEGAERKCISIMPWYATADSVDDVPIRCIEVNGSFKFSEISHRDYLGSLMGLGIKREKIGDILVHENKCHIIVKTEICDYIVSSFTGVAKYKVSCSVIGLDSILVPKAESRQKKFTVASNRLDCILAGVYNISRSDAAKLIEGDHVKVDFEPAGSASKAVSEGSVVSVRGRGRFKVEEFGDVTRKGRMFMIASILI